MITQITRWLTPWMWAPLALLLALEIYPVGTVLIGGAYLLIPLAGYLAARYGTNGWAVVATSGLIACVATEFLGTSRPELGIHIAALLVGWGLRDKPLTAATAPQLRLNPYVYLGIFLLPVQLGPGRWLLDIIEFNFLALLYLLVFLLGVRRLPVRPIVVALIVAATFGILLEYLELPSHAAELIGARRAELPLLGMTSLREWYLHYAFDSPAALLSALGFLYFGRFLGSPTDEVRDLPAPVVRVGLLLAMALVTFGGRINVALAPDYGALLHWFGQAYAVILLGMLAGLLFRFAGIVGMLFVAISFWWIDALLRAKPDDTELRVFIDLAELLYLYGFGLLGIAMRDAIQGTISTMWCWLWFRCLTLYLLVLFAVIDVDSGVALILLALSFVVGIALAMALERVWGRLRPQKIKVTGGWLSLLTVVMASYLVYMFSIGTWESALEMAREMSGLIGGLMIGKAALGNNLLMAAIAVTALCLTLSLIVSTLRKLIDSAGQLIDDLKALLERLHTGKPMVIEVGVAVSHVTLDVTSARPAARLQRVMIWSNRALLAGAVVAPLMLFGYNGWLEYQQDLADDRKLTMFSRSNEGGEREHDRQERERLKTEREQIRRALVERLSGVAIEVLAEFSDVVTEYRNSRAEISTGWQVGAVDGDVRRRVKVHISIASALRVDQTLPVELVPRSIRVQVERQERGRFGLWVEPGFLEKSDPELAKSLELEMEALAIARLTAE